MHKLRKQIPSYNVVPNTKVGKINSSRTEYQTRLKILNPQRLFLQRQASFVNILLFAIMVT